MGSGLNSSGYNKVKSQPYAPNYGVCTDEFKNDIETGVYKKETGYIKNPSAEPLNDLIEGNYIVDKHTVLNLPYVIDMDGNVIVGKRNGLGSGPNDTRTPHPTLIGGKNVRVQMAGILRIEGGKIAWYNNKSGHFKPNIKSMELANKIFNESFSKYFKKKKGGK